jgi:hypothetical protein
MRAVWRGISPRALWNKAPNPASVADAMTLAMMALMAWMELLYGCGGFYVMGVSMGLALKKKVPPARLRALASER